MDLSKLEKISELINEKKEIGRQLEMTYQLKHTDFFVGYAKHGNTYTITISKDHYKRIIRSIRRELSKNNDRMDQEIRELISN